MSDFGRSEIVLVPSRTRRRLMTGCGAASAILAATLLASSPTRAAALAAAVACAAAACAAVAGILRARGTLRVRLLPGAEADVLDTGKPAPPLRPAPRAWVGQAAAAWGRQGRGRLEDGAEMTLVGARAVHVSGSFIVLRAGRRQLTVWRDATDRDTFRRLAARARWGGGRP